MIFRIRSDWFGMAWIFRLLAIPLVTSFPAPNNGFHFEPHSNNQQSSELVCPQKQVLHWRCKGSFHLDWRWPPYPTTLSPSSSSPSPSSWCSCSSQSMSIRLRSCEAQSTIWSLSRTSVSTVYHVCALEARGIIWPLLISISWVYMLKAPSTTVYSSTSWTSKETFVDFLSELELSWADHV